MITVEICYFGTQEEILFSLKVPHGSTIARAIILSGILDRLPTLDFQTISTGIFGCKKPLQHTLAPGDRIEIYRPLIHHPNDNRLMRQRRQREKQSRTNS